MDIIAVANASRLPQRLISEGQRLLAACDHDGKSVPDKISPSKVLHGTYLRSCDSCSGTWCSSKHGSPRTSDGIANQCQARLRNC